MELLFFIPNPMKWTTDQVANIINALSAIGTVGALIYAFVLNRRNSRRINDLEQITVRLSEQNQLLSEQNSLQRLVMKQQVRPELVHGGGGSSGSTGEFSFELINEGHRAFVDKIDYNETDVLFSSKWPTPFIIREHGKDGSKIKFGGRSKGEKHINDCNWSMTIHFSDIYSNSYIAEVKGTGIEYKVSIKDV